MFSSLFFQEEEIKLKPVISFDCGKEFFHAYWLHRDVIEMWKTMHSTLMTTILSCSVPSIRGL